MARQANVTIANMNISRRNFVKFGGAAIAGSTLRISPVKDAIISQENQDDANIKHFKVLGRTGFKASDISMGTTRVRDTNVIRYVLDKGVNYIDTAEGYGNGRAERMIGENLKNVDRKKIFITSKIHVKEDETEDSILNRFRKCQERLQTEYIDAFYMHNVPSIDQLNHPAFHAATKKLKADGKLRFIGLSCHGPKGDEGDSMEKVMCAAAGDGRFDLMLFIYNFMNKEVGDRILAACKKTNVGTTAMKTSPGRLNVDTFDPDNLTEAQERMINRRMQRGASKEEAIAWYQNRIQSQQDAVEKTKPFVEKYGIKTADDLRKISIHWVAQKPDMHTTCVSFADFDLVDNIIPLSGTKLSRSEINFLEEYKLVFDNHYCRHGCNACVANCPHHLPVSTIMRYAYYYECQGREKDAMLKYAALHTCDASPCFGCDAPCLAGCPYHIDVQTNLVHAHSLLTLA